MDLSHGLWYITPGFPGPYIRLFDINILITT